MKSIYLPQNFSEQLPAILKHTKKWQTIYFSGNNNENQNYIDCYSPIHTKSKGNIIIIPGLATNTNIDPLMKTISYWTLTHGFTLYCINTFINKLSRYQTPSSVLSRDYDEYINVVYNSINHIANFTKNEYTCAIAHSAGSNGLISALNKKVSLNESIDISSTILFAPFVSNSWYKTLMDFAKRDKEYYQTNPGIIRLPNIFNHSTFTEYAHISYDFLVELSDNAFEPEKMNQWNIKTTMIAGDKDKKSPLTSIQDKYQQLHSMSNKDLFSLIVLKQTKHSFLNLAQNNDAILKIIKSQLAENTK